MAGLREAVRGAAGLGLLRSYGGPNGRGSRRTEMGIPHGSQSLDGLPVRQVLVCTNALILV